MNNIFFKKCLLSLNVPNMIIYGKPFLSDEILNYYHDINNIDHIIEKQFNNLSYKSSVYHYQAREQANSSTNRIKLKLSSEWTLVELKQPKLFCLCSLTRSWRVPQPHLK